MTPIETALVGGLLTALLGGAGLYVKLGRQVLTRPEHERECKKATEPIRDDIREIKETTRRLEDKQEDSTKDLSGKMHEVLILLNKMNGGK